MTLTKFTDVVGHGRAGAEEGAPRRAAAREGGAGGSAAAAAQSVEDILASVRIAPAALIMPAVPAPARPR